jgi:transposase
MRDQRVSGGGPRLSCGTLRPHRKGGPQDTATEHDTGAWCTGRSRCGLSTRIHSLVDANGLPILLKLTEGQAHDGRSATDMLDGIGADQVLLADRAYDSNALRETLAARGAWANIKPKPNRVNVPSISAFLYRYPQSRRTLLQQAQALQSSRRALWKALRHYLAPVKLASARIWMRFMGRSPRSDASSRMPGWPLKSRETKPRSNLWTWAPKRNESTRRRFCAMLA